MLIEVLQTFWMMFKIACFIAVAGGLLTYVVASVCQWMKWSPVNITINMTTHEDQ